MAQSTTTRPHRREEDPDASRMTWLLLVPVVLALLVPLYDRRDPALFGVPFFYWFQLAVIPVGVVCTTVVYLRTRAPRPSLPEPTGESRRG